MDSVNNLKKLLTYLLSIKNMDEKIIRDIKEYDRLFWVSDLNAREKSEALMYVVDATDRNVYDEIFKLYSAMEKEKYELVWTNYILVFKTEESKIVHPIISKKIDLVFDAVNAKFIFKLLDNKIKMETDIFDGINAPNIDKIQQLKEEIEDSEADINGALKKLVHYLSPNICASGEIQSLIEGKRNFEAAEAPVIYDAPLIIVRKMDSRLWHRELTNDLKLLDTGYKIPPTIMSMISDSKIEDEMKDKEVCEEVLFPLASNEEQREVARSLSKNFGLVVEGPPGTGKSQTIANLICHLLAKGERILITSQTGKALKVLADKIPDEIKPLCLNILGDDSMALRDIDNSLRIITEKLAIMPEDLKREIQELQNDLKSCKSKKEELLKKLNEIDNIESNKIKVNGKLCSLIDIAKWVRENERDFSWIEDNIKFDWNCPMTDEEFFHLIELLDSCREDDYIQVNRFKEKLKKVPDYSNICESIKRLKKAEDKYETAIDNLKDWSISYNHKLDYEALINILSKAERKMLKIENSWLKKVMEDYYNSEIVRPVLKHLYMRSDAYIRDISEIQRRLTVHNIVIPNGKSFDEFKKDFKFIYANIKKKGSLSKLYKRTHKKYSYIYSGCFVDDKEITKISEAEIINLYIVRNKLETDFTSFWNKNMKEYNGFKAEHLNINSIVVLEACIKDLGTVIDWNVNVKSKIIKHLGNIAALEEIDWYKSSTYTYLKNIVESLKNINDCLRLKAYILNIKKLIDGDDCFNSVTKAIDSMDIEAIKEAYVEIDRLKALVSIVDDIEKILNKIRYKAPKFVSKFISSTDRRSFKNINKAWDFSRFKNLLLKANNIRTELVEKLLKEEEIKERRLIENIASKRAWYKQIKNTSDTKKKSLYAWLQAAKKIGRGRSKFIDKYIDAAQREMENCKDSIPVWIMPLNKVIENIKVSDKPFDVIIFDESSQCDLFSICALFRAKKAIVVGDDKQISPQFIGIDQAMVGNLMKKYIKDIPHAECFDLEASLYSTALRCFPKRVFLKEHFRCLPEIIGFNNKLFYSNEIVPLRYEYKSSGVNNPIKAIKVLNGEKDKLKNINIEEAKAIVGKIVECIRNDDYEGMSMGVISMLGDAQAEMIEAMLKKEIGEEEILKRKLTCGDAYSFQGDERDIIFLSLVVADNVKFTALTKESDIRRFNVAVSRARNEVMVFFSIDIENSNPECIRTKLIKYCMDQSERKQKIHIAPKIFKSSFHRKIFSSIKEKGYDISCFEELKEYGVDFVVEGSKNRIGIICNDSTRRGNDFKEEYKRKIELERVGWKFYKISESEFYMMPREVMDNLWIKLNFLGIEKIIA